MYLEYVTSALEVKSEQVPRRFVKPWKAARWYNLVGQCLLHVKSGAKLPTPCISAIYTGIGTSARHAVGSFGQRQADLFMQNESCASLQTLNA
jgi:hypothetical protein